jgi:hypothetical protein
MNRTVVRGEVVHRDDGVYAVFSASNTVEAASQVRFHYAAVCTPGLSPLMRMVPQPRLVKGDRVELELPPLSETIHEVKIEDVRRPEPEATNALVTATSTNAPSSGGAWLAAAPSAWALLVSVQAIGATNGFHWGATAPVLQGGSVELGDTPVVIAATPSVGPTP